MRTVTGPALFIFERLRKALRFCFCFAGSGFCCFLLALRRQRSVGLRGELFERAKRTRGNTNPLAIQDDGLQVYVLAAFCCDVGVAAGLPEIGSLASQLVDAGHKIVVGRI